MHGEKQQCRRLPGTGWSYAAAADCVSCILRKTSKPLGCHSFWPALMCAAAICVCNTKRQADNPLTDAGVECHGAAAATASAPATFHLLVETTVCRF